MVPTFLWDRLYLDEYLELEGTQNFVNAVQNYPLLVGTQSNLYKCFVDRSWSLCCGNGVQAFIHPEGVYDDSNGGAFRAALYPRLRGHFHFRNETMLFPDIRDTRQYSVNVQSTPQSPRFYHISNLFDVKTIDRSFSHDGTGSVGGIKNDHLDRITVIDTEALTLFARLYDDPETPALEARLPQLHSSRLLHVLRKLADYPRRLADIKEDYKGSLMWEEAGAVTAGIIRRETGFPQSVREWILSGPHISPANPFSKTPRRVCAEKAHYDSIDLTEVPVDYLPRTNFVPACKLAVYNSKTPRVAWGSQEPITNCFRIISRRRLSQTGERTLMAALLPPGVGHIDACFSITFREASMLICFGAACSSLALDFFVKTTGKTDLKNDLAGSLPAPHLCSRAILRFLLLCCLNSQYMAVWRDAWLEAFRVQRWSKHDLRLRDEIFAALKPEWCWTTPLRTDYERRQALVELDVLVARQLGLTLDELKTIYRIQFPVLRQNEQDTWYDQRGRIVFTNSKAVPGVGFSRPEWERIKTVTSGTVTRTIGDDTLPGGPRERVIEYVAPFDRCERESDYATAWKFFDEAGL